MTGPTTTLETLRDTVAQHGGNLIEGRAGVELLSRGLLVRVSVYGTGIFDRSIRFEELGLSSDDGEISEYISPGTKSYAPAFSKRLASWGTQCRQAVDKYSVHLNAVDALTGSATWRFLYFDAYDDFRERWDELLALRTNIIEDVEAQHAHLIENAVEFYREQAGKSWDLLQRRYPGGVAIRIPKAGLVFGPTERYEYLRWVEANVQTDFPGMEKLRASVRAEYTVNVLFDPASLAQNQADSAEARAREERANRDRVHAEMDRWELGFERQAREEAIRAAEMERARQRIAETTDIWGEAMEQLLGELAGYIQALLTGLDKNGFFRGRALEQIDSMADTFRLLGGQYLGDRQIEDLIQDLRARKLAKPSEGLGREAWRDQIQEGLVALRGHINTQTAAIEQRMQANTRAGALEL